MSIPVVYDTMLFLQQAARPDRLHASFQAVHDGRVTLSVSAELLAEIRDVLTRPEHRSKFPAMTREAVADFLTDLTRLATLIDPVSHLFTWPHHPDDDHLFNLAIAGGATYLVTWETRILNPLEGQSAAAQQLGQLAPNLSIITPKQLPDRLRA